jgi:hypothetical protein
MEDLEIKRRDSYNFTTAQHIVTLLDGLEDGDVEATIKLVNEILQSKEQRNIAVISYRRSRLMHHNVQGS